MHRFVGMIIVIIPANTLGSLVEKRSQLCQCLLLAAHELHHAINVMRNKPALLIQVRLFAAETVGCARIVTPRGVCTVFLTRVKPSHFRIERIAIILPPFFVKCRICLISQSLCQLRKTPVKVSILQRFRHAHHRVSSLTIAETFGGVAGITVGLFHIVLTDTFQIGIRQYRYRRIANHTTAISIQKLPTVVIFMSTLFGQ